MTFSESAMLHESATGIAHRRELDSRIGYPNRIHESPCERGLRLPCNSVGFLRLDLCSNVPCAKRLSYGTRRCFMYVFSNRCIYVTTGRACAGDVRSTWARSVSVAGDSFPVLTTLTLHRSRSQRLSRLQPTQAQSCLLSIH